MEFECWCGGLPGNRNVNDHVYVLNLIEDTLIKESDSGRRVFAQFLFQEKRGNFPQIIRI
jgi:hypothetical protein